MNERIKELAREAWEYADKHTQDGDGNFGMVHTYKLIELTMQECMKLNHSILCEDDPNYLDEVYLKHFGYDDDERTN
jgi:hypothetical protein